MKFFRSILFVCALSLASAGFMSRTAQADPVSFDYFYDNLQPYGQWMEVGDYGYCWQPNGVDENWRPYADGYWASTDEGWTWVSYEDFGDITYHYGRWAHVDDVGWVWRPDYQWAPAWVSWRHGGGYEGWAPLPPEARWDSGIGISVWVDSHYGIGPEYYNFCPIASFGSPFLGPVILDRRRNFAIMQNTVNVTNITVNNGVIYSGGPQYSVIAAASKRPIPRLKIERAAGGPGDFHSKAGAGKLLVSAPAAIEPPKEGFKPAKIAKTIAQPKIDKGWGQIDPAQKGKLEAKMKAEHKGATPEDHPAKPVSAAELKFVPQKTKTPETTLPSIEGGKNKKGKPTPEPEEKVGKGKKPETSAPLEPFTGEPKTGENGKGKKPSNTEPLNVNPNGEEKKAKPRKTEETPHNNPTPKPKPAFNPPPKTPPSNPQGQENKEKSGKKGKPTPPPS